MAGTINGRAGRGEAQGARRSRQGVRRPHRVEFALTGEEFDVLESAAGRAGLARGAYAAEAALAAARGTATPTDAPLREALAELICASGLVRRIGVNLNQAVAKLKASSDPEDDPERTEAFRCPG